MHPPSAASPPAYRKDSIDQEPLLSEAESLAHGLEKRPQKNGEIDPKDLWAYKPARSGIVLAAFMGFMLGIAVSALYGFIVVMM